MPSEKSLEILMHKVETSESEMFDWGDYRLGYFISKNKDKSSSNEDTVFIVSSQEHLIFGVSDGAGGHPKGDEAAFLTAQTVIENFKKQSFEDVKMITLIEDINDRVLDMKAGARCTLALATISQDCLRSFSVGDSEVIYWNSLGSQLYSNIPHSEIGYQIEAGVLEQEESLDDPDRYIVNNMLGDRSIRIEVASKMNIKKGHTVLLGSDGLFDNLSHEQLTEMVGKGSFEKSFEELVEKCLIQDKETWKKDDDISFVMLRKIKA